MSGALLADTTQLPVLAAVVQLMPCLLSALLQGRLVPDKQC
jgi:hypothetical protein